MVVEFTTTCAISTYHHWCSEFEPRSRRGVLDTTLCDNVCQWLAAGRWFSPGTLVSFTNKTDHHDITEILLKVAVNTINSNQIFNNNNYFLCHARVVSSSRVQHDTTTASWNGFPSVPILLQSSLTWKP